MKDVHGGVAMLALIAALIALVAPASVPAADPPVGLAALATSGCIPTNVVFYDPAADQQRVAQRMAANASPCANYYISVPPLAADKTALRPTVAGTIRALGPHFHAMAEINIDSNGNGWQTWVAADGSRTWVDAGVEARKRMAAAGFDVNAGDLWAVNDLDAPVRDGVGGGVSRQNIRDFVLGLWTGDGTTHVRGLVWVRGIAQPTTPLDDYKDSVKGWLGDGAFFDDFRQYVRFFSPEVYASVSNWAVTGTGPHERLGPLADYLEHFGTLASHAPAVDGAASAAIAQADAPTATAAWPRPAFGFGPLTNPTPVAVAQDFVSAQVYAFRHQQAGRETQAWGFAWNPSASGVSPPIPDFANKVVSILDRLAASIHASDAPTADPGIAACGPDLSWCDDSLDGSSVNPAWHVFNTWSQPVADDSSVLVQENTAADLTLNAGDADGDPLTYTIVSEPSNGTLDGSGPKVIYRPAPGFSGADSFTFKVNDGVIDSPTATVSIVVNAPPMVTVDPAGPVDEASPITLSARASDPEGASLTVTWSTDKGTIVPAGDAATLTVDDGPDVAHVRVTVDDGNGGTATSTADVEVRNVPPTADAGADTTAVWGVPLTLNGSASDPSHTDTEHGLLPQWLFGDGSTGEGMDVSHVYANPGTYTATLTVRDKDGGLGGDSATITIGPRPVSLESTTAATVDAGSAVVSARLVDGIGAASSRLDGHSVALAIGSSTCFATTDAAGAAHCRLARSSLPLGPATATARFDGDTLYQAASTSSPVLLYRLPAGGLFAVGDKSASGQVTFWSPSWWLANTLSGGAAPASFKGFLQPSGSGWIASPGFASAPATVPGWMGVLIAKSVTKDGAVITGDGMHMIVVHVDSYDPTLIGLGTVVASAN